MRVSQLASYLWNKLICEGVDDSLSMTSCVHYNTDASKAGLPFTASPEVSCDD